MGSKKIYGIGWTADLGDPAELDLGIINDLIDDIPDEKLRDSNFLADLDNDKGTILGSKDIDDVNFPGWLRYSLKNGAKVYNKTTFTKNNGLAVQDYIQGAALVYTYAHDGSLGDKPFKGYNDLLLFVGLAAVEPTIAGAACFICGGLPNADEVALYAKLQK